MEKCSNQLQISVVMVTRNEEMAVEKVVSGIRQVVPQAEILIVDSSSDSTAIRAEKMGCRVIRQLPPRGYGPALDVGLKSARGDIIVTLDCDDTYPPEAIDILLEKIREGYDVVSASRLQVKPVAMSWQNYLANRAFAICAGIFCGVRVSDLHTGMRAYRKSALKSLAYDPRGMALPVELLVGAIQQGYKCCEIYIDYRPRIGQTTLQPIAGTIWTLRRLWRCRRKGLAARY